MAENAKPTVTGFLDSLDAPLVIYDPRLRIVQVNKAFLQGSLWTASDVLGRPCYHVFYGRTAPCAKCHVLEVFRTGIPVRRSRDRDAGRGNRKHLELFAYPVKDGEGHVRRVIEYCHDVSPLRVLEETIGIPTSASPVAGSADSLPCLSNRYLFEGLSEILPEGLLVIDPDTRIIVYANDAFHREVGLRPPLAVGRRCHEILLGTATPCNDRQESCPLSCDSTDDWIEGCVTSKTRLSDLNTLWFHPLTTGNGCSFVVARLWPAPSGGRAGMGTPGGSSWDLDALYEITNVVFRCRHLKEATAHIGQVIKERCPDGDVVLLILNHEGFGFVPVDASCWGASPLAQWSTNLMREPQAASRCIEGLRGCDLERVNQVQDRSALPGPIRRALEKYLLFHVTPIMAHQRLTGYCLWGSMAEVQDRRRITRFLDVLMAQLGAHIRHLIIHESGVTSFQGAGAQVGEHDGIIGRSKKMLEVYELIDLVAASDATVLITGENGTGKELVARAVHNKSDRRRGPFIVAHCSAYSPTLLESELFGHEKGAFTGAIRRKMGRIERAQGGTLFLDEIGDIAPATQVLLLRFLQDHRFERVGGEKTLDADVRVLAATNRDLVREVEAGRFRDDLYYRLNVISIHLPPLRERKEDIPFLCHYFLQKFNRKEGKKLDGFSPGALQSMLDYDWPGNVRQLENAVSHAVILAQDDVIRREHLPRFLREVHDLPMGTSLVENEKRLLIQVLRQTGWNKHEAARRLQVSRSTLYSKIRRYGLQPPS